MLMAIGAASSIFDTLKSLTSSGASSSQSATGLTQSASTPFDFSSITSTSTGAGSSSSGGTPQSGGLSSDMLSALLAAQGQQPASTSSMSPQDSLKDLFSQLDADGNGQISKSEFENALGAGGTNVAQADDVFSKMDKNGDGSVSLDEMGSSLKGADGHHGHGHHHAGGAGGSGGSSDPLMQALDGASSTTTTNSDGSTTTSMTYADGTKVTLTTPAASTATNSATSSYNFVEQAIQRQAQALSASTASSVSLSA